MRVRSALFAACFLVPVSAGAQALGFGPIVLQLPASTRAIGFGNAYVAVRDPEAVFYNPAELGVRPGVALSVERYGSVSTAGAVASSYVFGPFGFAIGAQLLDFHTGSIAYPDLAPNGEQLGIDLPLAVSSQMLAKPLGRRQPDLLWLWRGRFDSARRDAAQRPSRLSVIQTAPRATGRSSRSACCRGSRDVHLRASHRRHESRHRVRRDEDQDAEGDDRERQRQVDDCSRRHDLLDEDDRR